MRMLHRRESTSVSKNILFLLCSAAAFIYCCHPARAACLSYANRVFITGTLTRQVYPGPPNYESIARGDRPEIYYVMRLIRAICVDADPTDSLLPSRSKVTEIHLVLNHEQYLQFEKFLGREVGVSGILFASHTGHHHTPVLMENVTFGRGR